MRDWILRGAVAGVAALGVAAMVALAVIITRIYSAAGMS